ncbi:MAG: hypothetical protein IPM29_05475 [Planctomycetes bacterium]|nr:hypothetical protein [Planctomycetota bacterium]
MTISRRSLLGASTHTLDDKYRLIIAKRHVDVLGPDASDFVLTAHPDGCLLLMDGRSFRELSDRIGGDLLDQVARERDVRRMLLGHAEEVKPDKTGRLLIPETLRGFLGLGEDSKEVVAVGSGDWIELWHPRQWLERRNRAVSGSLSSEQVVSQAS